MMIATWLLYIFAAACVAAGLLLLSPPVALVALGLLVGRIALLSDKDVAQ